MSSTATKPGSDPARAIPILLDKHGPRLRALALRLCGNAADADDMVQNVFLQAFRKWHLFRGDADPGTWLYAIAARACRARTRRTGGPDRRVPAMSQLMPWTETTVMRIAASASGQENQAERNEAIASVQGAIVRLPEHLRLPLVLKDVLEMSVEDVAAALGLVENTVKTRLHRARLALRKIMTAKASHVPAAPPIYEKQVCLDLLKAKMDAMDRGGTPAGFRVPKAEVCDRCRAVFRELDLVQDACAQISEGDLPAPLRAAIKRAIDAGAGAASPTPSDSPRSARSPRHRTHASRSRPARS
ncbi:MAG: sigma-70 family RNA polymerase sigma factor [Phycisphaerae bacterium]|nr:sigma-70 family RNA polymerase sigma factor [Phycisphaerae bacterium]